MGHNFDLPKHLYVWVAKRPVMVTDDETGRIPAVWFGMSSTPGRAFGCHVILENGAQISDLPPHFLSIDREPRPAPLGMIQRWDCFGWEAEAYEFDYLSGRICRVLHEKDPGRLLPGAARYLFSVDWIENGYSDYPEQHKIMHCLHHETGNVVFYPNDVLLWADPSFTELGAPPPIKRQRGHWSVEDELSSQLLKKAMEEGDGKKAVSEVLPFRPKARRVEEDGPEGEDPKTEG